MRRALDSRARGEWDRARRVDSVTLDYDHRCRRRLVVDTDGGGRLLLDFARPPRLRQGDGLLLEDGGVVEVRAAPEALMEITCTSRLDLVRIAWHIGNRHFPAELHEDAVRIREDHVLADMVAGLGAQVRAVQGPFDPEGGAYDGRPATPHHHHHGHGGHDHDHDDHDHDDHDHDDHDHSDHGHHHHHGHGHAPGTTHRHGNAYWQAHEDPEEVR